MNVLVVGNGGREHAIAWKLGQSKLVKRVYCAPGNAGTSLLAENVSLDILDNAALADFAERERIDLTVVGPEAPLLNGVVDLFEERGLAVFGPRKAAAMLEGSKVFAKRLMQKHGIPTGRAQVLDDADEARSFVEKNPWARVIKAEGLAQGKGVYVCDTLEETQRAIEELMVERRFGAAGTRVLAEERLSGREVSVLALSDGTTVRALLPAQDHKRAYDQDRGPNTGGMGAYAPARLTAEEQREVMALVLEPTVRALRDEGTLYKGVLYAGLMLTPVGIRVLEFNCRFGDPETQPILALLETDLYALLESCATGTLAKQQVTFREGAACCVVLASGGYPNAYEKGKRIHGLTEASALADLVVFHAGTRKEGSGAVTDGGRVLGVTGIGSGIQRAVENAYLGVSRIYFDRMHYRRDIGKQAVQELKEEAR